IAEHLCTRRIDVDEAAFGKTAVDALDGGVEQRAVAVNRRLFARALRRAVAFGDVLDDGKHVAATGFFEQLGVKPAVDVATVARAHRDDVAADELLAAHAHPARSAALHGWT